MACLLPARRSSTVHRQRGPTRQRPPAYRPLCGQQSSPSLRGYAHVALVAIMQLRRSGHSRHAWRQRRAAGEDGQGSSAATWLPTPPSSQWAQLLTRASATYKLGRPHRAISDLLRIMAAGEEVAGRATCDAARIALDQLLPQQRSFFESLMPRRGEDVESQADPMVVRDESQPASKEGVGRHCIYQIKHGSLLFRRGAPDAAKEQPQASYSGCSELSSLRSDLDGKACTDAASRAMPSLQPMPCVDPSQPDGAAAVLAGARAPHAFAIRRLGLAEEAEMWTGSMLAAELDGVPCHVLSAPPASQRFTYYWGGGSDVLHSHYEEPTRVKSIGMTYDGFRAAAGAESGGAASALYLQTGLMQRSPSGELEGKPLPGKSFPALLSRLRVAADYHHDDAAAGEAAAVAAAADGGGDDAMRARRLGAIRTVQSVLREGRMGRYARTSFFASRPGAVTSLHFDHYDNLYMQLRGRKRFVLFAPLQAAHLYPFPLHHPLDQRSRIDLDAVAAAASPSVSASFPRLREARGFEIDLGPGDLLFIPHHWWHYVETTHADDAVDGLSLSLNLWFDFKPRLSSPQLPLSPGLHLELARHVEAWLGSVIGETSLPEFLSCCAVELAAGSDRGDAAAVAAADAATHGRLSQHWLVARNLLLCELATSWIGWKGLRQFFDELLFPERFRGLRPVSRVGG